ncbi:MAG: glycosyltransferase family 87 protein [Polyangia bacterium]
MSPAPDLPARRRRQLLAAPLPAPLLALLGLAAAALLVLVPIALWRLDTRLLGSTYGKPFQPFELFGFCVTAALACFGAHKLRRAAPGYEIDRWAGAAGLILTSLYTLPLLVDHPLRSWDYECYEQAARALLAGRDPYAGTGYLYPPLVAQAFAGAYRLVHAAVQAAHLSGLGDVEIFGCLFYAYQCLQLFLVVAAFALCRVLAQRLGLRPAHAAVLCTLLFVFNNPLLRTLKHGQVNLYVLDAILVAMLVPYRGPLAVGLGLALATHIKLYPILFVLPLWWIGARSAATWAVGLTAAGFVLERRLAGGVLMDFVRSLPGFPRGTLLRDNSLHSIVYNFAHALALDRILPARAVDVAALLLGVGLSGWIFWRVFVRTALAAPAAAPDGAARARDQAGLFGFTLLIMMLLSPLVWEHHYVLTLPLAIWALARCLAPGTSRPRRFHAVLAAALVYTPPTFDVFPVSYHRLAGLLWLLWLATRPPSPDEPRAAA